MIGVLVVFILVYAGMIFGNLPGLALDRTGIALLGAIAMIEVKQLALHKALAAVDLPSIAILFSFMVISAQLYHSGFYELSIQKLIQKKLRPERLLFIVIFFSAFLSALLINDIVCLALAPLILKMSLKKKLNPQPFLFALALSSNIGSALTLIGNPQNMLIGQVFRLSFSHYVALALVPCVLGCIACWWLLCRLYRDKWHVPVEIHPPKESSIAVDRWQSFKGIFVVFALVLLFFLVDIPREYFSLAGAGLLLLSRKSASKLMLNSVDWLLLVLFIGLFIVNYGFAETGLLKQFLLYSESKGINLSHSLWLFPMSAVLSNIVSNVPAVMLLIPFVQNNFGAALLAVSSTFAGNFLLIGSIANLIVAQEAAKQNVPFPWKKHFVLGAPITLFTLLVSALWAYVLFKVGFHF